MNEKEKLKLKNATPELVEQPNPEHDPIDDFPDRVHTVPDSESSDKEAAEVATGVEPKSSTDTALTIKSPEIQSNSQGDMYDEDASNMVRQAKKLRPSASLVSIAEIFDIGVIGMFGGLMVAISVGIIGFFIPGLNHDVHSIVACALSSGVIGFFLYAVSALIPIFFPVALLALQIAGGSLIGPVALKIICATLGADLSNDPGLEFAASTWLSFVYSILPILACPLYFALSLSSKWQTSLGWSLVGLMVCDEKGQRASFAKAWKRTLIRLWWPVMFPAKLAYSGLIDDWVEENSKTVLVLKPQNLKAQLIKAKDQVSKSKDKITIKAQASVSGAGTKQLLGKRMEGAALSAQALKKMLKPDWPAMILRSESYLIVMLFMLFMARSTASGWTHLFFHGHKSVLSGNIINAFMEQNPWVESSLPVGLALFYIVLLLLVRRQIPQVLELTSKGFALRTPEFWKPPQRKNWSDVTAVHLQSGTGKDPEEKWLVFALRNQAPVRVRLDIIRSISSREEILRALERWAPHAEKDSDLIRALEPPSDYSYTDIWLEALSGPPKRDKLKPLISGAVLKDSQYRVTDVIAVGGQGSVYLAKDVVSNEDAVLKEFVLPVYVDLSIRRKAIERFEKEARLLKGLEHPRIVKLLDYFVEDYRAYMVLEHLNGNNLHNLVKEKGKLDEKEVIGLALQMCEMLKCLHEQSPPVVHRDFTPENLILGKDGTLKLIDFNVAQELDQSATTTGTVVGKPSYLAPEQFRGEPSEASDVYSFGATLAYMLTGQDPTPISQSHPAEAVPTISAALDQLVAQCTSYDSNLRFKTIQEIEIALRSC